MEIITLTNVSKKDADKNGKAYIGKTGRPYSRASIQCSEYGTEWFGGFYNPALVVGAKIEVEITSREYQGKTYRDFTIVKKEEKLASELSHVLTKLGKLDFKIDSIIRHLSGVDRLDRTSAGTPMPDFGEDKDNIPD